MKVKRVIAICLTMAAVASCVVVPTVMAGDPICASKGRGKYQFYQSGSSTMSVQGWCGIDVTNRNGSKKIDVFITTTSGRLDAFKEYDLKVGFKKYLSRIADKTSDQRCEGVLYK
jgi:hypothetical protein